MTTTFSSNQIKHVKEHTEATFKKLQTKEAIDALGSGWFGCAACKVGLNAVAAAPIAAALAIGAATLPEDTVVVTVVAEFCGISETAATAWLASAVAAGATSVEEFISFLCTKMGACS